MEELTLDHPFPHIALLAVLAGLHSKLRSVLLNLGSILDHLNQSLTICNHLEPTETLDIALSHDTSDLPN